MASPRKLGSLSSFLQNYISETMNNLNTLQFLRNYSAVFTLIYAYLVVVHYFNRSQIAGNNLNWETLQDEDSFPVNTVLTDS